MKHLARSCYILPMLLCATGAVQAEDNSVDTLTEMATKGKANLDFRYRYERIDPEGGPTRTRTARTVPRRPIPCARA